MKEESSDTMKKVILCFVLGAIIFGSITGVIAYNYNATDVAYGETTVDAALKDLYTKSSTIGGSFTQSINPMVSNTSDDGVASSNSIYSTSAVYRAFDGNRNNASDSAAYHSADYVFPNDNGIYVRFNFNNSRKIYYAIWYGRGVSYTSRWYQTPKTYKFQASNDGNTWVDLTELISNDKVTSGVKEKVQFTKNVDTYKYYQMIVYESNDNEYGAVAIDEIEYYE